MEIKITHSPVHGILPEPEKLGFGNYFTDHMFLMDYSEDRGWHDARIVPYGPLTLSPASSVLHYGTEVFEGLKAYRRPDGRVQLFRPWENVARLNRSCDRLGLPQLNPDDALQAIRTLVTLDQRWVPTAPGTSLYIRPFLFSNDPKLGLHGVHDAMFVIILSPVGSYFASGLKPVKIMVETEDVRAVRGGTGEAKCGGNYGAANRAGERATAKGFSQVLWMDAIHHKYVEEGGGMNVMFKLGGKVVTPMLHRLHPAGHHPYVLSGTDAKLGSAGGRTAHQHRRAGGSRRCGHAGRSVVRGHRGGHLPYRRAVLQRQAVYHQPF